MNIENTLNTAIKTLTQFNIPNANLDSEILLAKIIGKDRNYIIYIIYNLNSDNTQFEFNCFWNILYTLIINAYILYLEFKGFDRLNII